MFRLFLLSFYLVRIVHTLIRATGLLEISVQKKMRKVKRTPSALAELNEQYAMHYKDTGKGVTTPAVKFLC